MPNRFDRRYCAHELRAVTDDTEGRRTIRGYAALFNSRAEIMPGDGGWDEVILPGAFDDVIAAGPDVRALFNHDANYVLGRTASGTLRLGVDTIGLWYEAAVPETTWASDLLATVARGDVSQSSFAFTVAASNWRRVNGERDLREVVTIGELFDVSPVTFPAYTDTTVSARSLADYESYRESLAAGGAAERVQREHQARERLLTTYRRYDHDHRRTTRPPRPTRGGNAHY